MWIKYIQELCLLIRWIIRSREERVTGRRANRVIQSPLLDARASPPLFCYPSTSCLSPPFLLSYALRLTTKATTDTTTSCRVGRLSSNEQSSRSLKSHLCPTSISPSTNWKMVQVSALRNGSSKMYDHLSCPFQLHSNIL